MAPSLWGRLEASKRTMESFRKIIGKFNPYLLGDEHGEPFQTSPIILVGRKFQKIERTHRMKKHTLIVTLITAGLVGGTLAAETPLPAASPGPRCRASSWDPGLYTFYGKKETIVEKLANIQANLSERRVFVQVTQGDSSADVKLYEQQENGTFTVTEWHPKETSRLLADIDKAIVANKGVNCVGEQVKGVLGKELKEGKVVNGVAAPGSPEAAFSHSVKEAVGDFIKTTAIILC